MPKNRVLITKGAACLVYLDFTLPDKLSRLIGAPGVPTLIDARLDEDKREHR